MVMKVLKISATIFKIRLLPVPVHKQNQEAFEGNQSALLCSPPASLQQLPQGQGGGSVERVLQPGNNFSTMTDEYCSFTIASVSLSFVEFMEMIGKILQVEKVEEAWEEV